MSKTLWNKSDTTDYYVQDQAMKFTGKATVKRTVAASAVHATQRCGPTWF